MLKVIDLPDSEVNGHAILTKHFFARDAGGKLYIFAEGAYRPGGEAAVRRAVKHLLDELGASARWSVHRADETAAYIAVDAPELWERPPLDVLNLSNGLLSVNARELRPHDPAFLSAVQLPVSFDPAATCPAWEQFITDVFPADALDLPWQLAAWLVIPATSIQKAVLLLGEGANGKSTSLAGLTAFLGKKNVAGLSLHRLESDRFSVARLVGKLANICPDLPSAHLAGTSTFKALTGGDTLLAERKYADSFEFVPFARLLFSANHPPRSGDATHAFFRRWLVVPFTRAFEGAQAIPRAELDTRLADPRELSGVLNRALDALADVLANGLAESESVKAAWDELRATTDPLAVWLDANTNEGPDLIVPKRDLLGAYNAASMAAQRPTMAGAAFGMALKRIRHRLEEAQRTVNAEPRVWVWLGIGLRTQAESNGSNARNDTCCLPGAVKE